VQILSDRKPRKARELVLALKEQLGREDVEKHIVNSILLSRSRWRGGMRPDLQLADSRKNRNAASVPRFSPP
jgi:hypothetical protein